MPTDETDIQDQETQTEQAETVETHAPASDSQAADTSTRASTEPPRDALGRFLKAHGIEDEGEPEPEPKAAKETAEDTEDEGAAEDETDDSEDGSDEEADSRAKAKDKPKLSEKQQRAARDLGYSDDEIAEMDPAVYGKVVEDAAAKLGRKMSELGRAQQKQPPAKGGTKPDAAAGETKAKEADKQPAPEAGQYDDLSFEFTADDLYDAEKFPQKVNAVVAQLRRLMGRQAERDEIERTARNDAFFAGLVGDDKKPLFPEFGLGRMADFRDDAEEVKARNALLQEAEAIAIGFKAIGRPISDDEAKQRAIDHYGRDKIEKAAENRVRAKVADRRRHAVPAASNARKPNAAAKDSDARLNEALDRFERNTGVKIPDSASRY